MMIRVKLIANYRDALPPGHKHGVVELDVPEARRSMTPSPALTSPLMMKVLSS
jgi:hypothetical protein